MTWMTRRCHSCGEQMTIQAQPEERRRYLPPGERPSMLTRTQEEWICPNGHYSDLSYEEVRLLE